MLGRLLTENALVETLSCTCYTVESVPKLYILHTILLVYFISVHISIPELGPCVTKYVNTSSICRRCSCFYFYFSSPLLDSLSIVYLLLTLLFSFHLFYYDYFLLHLHLVLFFPLLYPAFYSLIYLLFSVSFFFVCWW